MIKDLDIEILIEVNSFEVDLVEFQNFIEWYMDLGCSIYVIGQK